MTKIKVKLTFVLEFRCERGKLNNTINNKMKEGHYLYF